ncbi:hypothetical protein DL93DRAFT_549447 [Clavulina sp. PMI_390]|nr:hypothetical protein DL93DRAFT_549447 [Clavulina sp. PMI_390]
MGTAANPAPPVSPSISAVFSSGRRKDSTASTTVPPSITSATPAATSPTSSTTPTSPRSPPADADTMLSSMLRSMAANVSSSKNTPHSRTQTPAHALESSAGPKPNINKPLPVASSTRSSRANSVASASGPTIPGPSSTSHPNSTPTTMASTSSSTSTQAIPTSRLRTKSGSGLGGVPSSFRGSAVPASGSAGMSEQPTVRASSASSDAAGNTKPNPQLATRGRSHSIRSPTAPPPPSSFSASVPSTPAAGSKPSRIARRSASNTSLSSANGASSNAKPNPTPTSASSGGRMTMTEAALAHAALSGRTSPDVNDLLKSTPRPGKKKSNASLRTAVTGSSASASASVRSGRGHSVSRSTSRASAQRRASGTGSEADGDATVPSSVAGAKKKKKHSLRGSASAPNALSSGPSTSASAVPPVPSLPSAYPHSSSLTSTSTSTPHHQPSVASSSARHQLSETTRRATQGMKMDLSSTPSIPADLVSPTESTGDDAWMTPASSSDYEDEDEDGHAWTRRRLSDLDVDPNGDEAKAGGLGEDDGEGSGSDESSIDLKTPLPCVPRNLLLFLFSIMFGLVLEFSLFYLWLDARAGFPNLLGPSGSSPLRHAPMIYCVRILSSSGPALFNFFLTGAMQRG